MEILDNSNHILAKNSELDTLRRDYSELERLFTEQATECRQLTEETAKKYSSGQLREMRTQLQEKERKCRQL